MNIRFGVRRQRTGTKASDIKDQTELTEEQVASFLLAAYGSARDQFGAVKAGNFLREFLSSHEVSGGVSAEVIREVEAGLVPGPVSGLRLVADGGTAIDWDIAMLVRLRDWEAVRSRLIRDGVRSIDADRIVAQLEAGPPKPPDPG